MDAQEKALDDPTVTVSNAKELGSVNQGSAIDSNGASDEYVTVELHSYAVDETVDTSPVKIRTRSKSRKLMIPNPIMPSGLVHDQGLSASCSILPAL
jgi:hypothetical protein